MYTHMYKVDTCMYSCIYKDATEHGTISVNEIALHAVVRQVCLYIYVYIYIHTYIYVHTYT